MNPLPLPTGLRTSQRSKQSCPDLRSQISTNFDFLLNIPSQTQRSLCVTSSAGPRRSRRRAYDRPAAPRTTRSCWRAQPCYLCSCRDTHALNSIYDVTQHFYSLRSGPLSRAVPGSRPLPIDRRMYVIIPPICP
jgi:hypothetical protein